MKAARVFANWSSGSADPPSIQTSLSTFDGLWRQRRAVHASALLEWVDAHLGAIVLAGLLVLVQNVVETLLF